MGISYVDTFPTSKNEDDAYTPGLETQEHKSLQLVYNNIQAAAARQLKILAAIASLSVLSITAASFAALPILPIMACGGLATGVAAKTYRAALNKQPPYIILSLDGGGIRGLVSAKILSMIEEEVGCNIGDIVDCIAGTSVGGLLALSLSKADPMNPHRTQYSAKEFLQNLSERASSIFYRTTQYAIQTAYGVNGPKYTSNNLEEFLYEKFGEATLGSSCKDVIVTSFDLKTNHGVGFHHFNDSVNPEMSTQLQLKDIGLATTAAPTYFPSKKIEDPQTKRIYNLVDGGLWANNPILAAYSICQNKLNLSDRDVFIISVGTGSSPLSPVQAEDSKYWGYYMWGPRIVDVLFSAMDQIVNMQLKLLKKEPNVHILRLQPNLVEASQSILDNTDPQNIKNLQMIAEQYFSALLDDGLRESLINPLKEYRRKTLETAGKYAT